MLTSLLGIRLILLSGSTIPTPVSPDALNALVSLDVRQDADGGDGFSMTFTLGKGKTGDFGLLSSGAFDPDKRVIIGVILGASIEPLMDGIIYHHQVQPSNEPGHSTLTVMGRDVSVMLSLEEKDDVHKNLPDFLIVQKILANYPLYVQPPYLTTPTSDVPIELQRVVPQRESDLDFLKRLAKRNGYVFYIEPVTIGINSAYWGPENRIGLPFPALSINMGGATNVTSLHFSNDALAGTGASGSFVEPITKTSIKIPPLPSLKLPPLTTSPSSARRKTLLRDTARLNPAQAAAQSAAAATNTPDSVRAEGEVDSIRYGAVLRARKLVGLRGAGISYDGNYFIRQVTHHIERGKYSQKFTLSRDGTGSLLPIVRP